MFSRKHQQNASVEHPAPALGQGQMGQAAPAPTNITIQMPHPQDAACGVQPDVMSQQQPQMQAQQQYQQHPHHQQHQGGFAPGGQTFHTNDGQAHQFGAGAPAFQAPPAGATGAGVGASSLGAGTGTLHHGAGVNHRNGMPNPMNVQPVPEGGVAIEGRTGLPLGRPTVTDKVVGKLEQGVGRMAGDWKMQNQGELRATGGKAAAAGQARAPIQ